MNNTTSQIVSKIIADIKQNGDSALKKYTKKFDNVELKNLVCPNSELKKAATNLDKDMLSILKEAKQNIYDYHIKQRQNIKPFIYKKQGVQIKEQITCIKRVGVYIPGGRYPYPSSVFANVIPALAAGAKEIVVVTPAKNLDNVVKASLYILGVTKVFKIGGAQAIAALAYGTKSVPRVDIIVGPGNKFVMEAKRQVYGHVGIDSLAGPSDVAILTDDSANIDFVVEDLLAQKEHDDDAKAFLVSTSKRVIEKTKTILGKKMSKQIKFIYEKNLSDAIDEINNIAPEHLEIMTKSFNQIISRIENAGAVFIGKWTPVALGDYFLGPSHSLPTDKCARFSSGLSVNTFLKRRAIMSTNKDYIKKNGSKIEKFAIAEGMQHHANSIDIRKKI